MDAKPTQNESIRVRFSLASPEEILSWSNGEITTDKITDRNDRFTEQGLFCERIFGSAEFPWQCEACGADQARYYSVWRRRCRTCGQVLKNVRHSRLGHIELAVPIVHVWFLRSGGGLLAGLLGVDKKRLQRVADFEDYLVLNVEDNSAKVHIGDIVSRRKAQRLADQCGRAVRCQTGGAAINELLCRLSPEELRRQKTRLTEELESLAGAKRDFAAAGVREQRGRADLVNSVGLAVQSEHQPTGWKRSIRAVTEALRERDAACREQLTEFTEEFCRLVDRRSRECSERLRAVNAFLASKQHPEWMVLKYLPVLPPDLRPATKSWARREPVDPATDSAEQNVNRKDKSTLAVGSINYLYQRVIRINNRLRDSIQQKWPESMIRIQSKELQHAVDALLDNRLATPSILERRGDKMPSLADRLRGKKGSFRRNILGKVVDYSGRAVIVPEPALQIDQCGLPRGMAQELFKTHMIPHLTDLIREWTARLKDPQQLAQMLAHGDQRVGWSIFQAHQVKAKPAFSQLSDLMDEALQRTLQSGCSQQPPVVLLNRQPSLHRMNVQAFEPVLCDGDAIQLHPLACESFGADFDGDTMAVHVPLSKEAQLEARRLLLSPNQMLSPADGRLIYGPSQDIVLGCFWLTLFDPRRVKWKFVPNADLQAITVEADSAADSLVINFRQPKWLGEPGKIELQVALRPATQVVPDTERRLEVDVIDRATGESLSSVELSNSLESGRSKSIKISPQKHEDSLLPANFTMSVVLRDERQETSIVDFSCTVCTLIFSSTDELLLAYENRSIQLHEVVDLRMDRPVDWGDSYQAPRRIRTTVGRAIFNSILPPAVPFQNWEMDKTRLQRLVQEVFHHLGRDVAAKLLDRVKSLGFEMATRSGISVSMADLINVPQNKKDRILNTTDQKIDAEHQRFLSGSHTNSQRFARTLKVQNDAVTQMAEVVNEMLERQPTNPIRLMLRSGARGTPIQIQHLMAMRGVMSRADGGFATQRVKLTADEKDQTREAFLIRSNLRNGLPKLDYFFSTHGMYASLATTKLLTGDWGFLTRRLMYLAQSVVVTDHDCGASLGVAKPIGEAIVGRVSSCPVHNKQGQQILAKGELITAQRRVQLEQEARDKLIHVRSPLTCQASRGICQICYGIDLSTTRLIEIGAAVGITAVHSVSEPGTQMNLKMKHTGGSAVGSHPRQLLNDVSTLFEAYAPKNPAILAPVAGKVALRRRRGKRVIEISTQDGALHREPIEPEQSVCVQHGQIIDVGDCLTDGIPHVKELLRLADVSTVGKRITDEIQILYQQGGASINDKHIEVIVGQMLRWGRVIDPGESHFTPGSMLQLDLLQLANDQLKRPVVWERAIRGATRAAKASHSVLAAAAFQNADAILEAAFFAQCDPLIGILENVILSRRTMPICNQKSENWSYRSDELESLPVPGEPARDR